MAHNSGHFEKVRALAVGARVLVVGGSRAGAASQLTFFDHSSHKRVLAVDVPSHVAGLATGGDAVVAACGDGRLRIYKIGTGAFLREIEAHASRQVPRLEGRHGGTVLAGAVAVAVAPDADRVVSAGVDGWLRVHSLASGKKLHEWQVSNQPLRAAAFDPSGEFVAGAGDDGVVHVVTVVNGERRELPGHEGPVNALAFTPRDGRILSGGEDGTLRLFFLVGDTEGEARGNDDSNHVGPVLAVVFAPSPKGASAEHSDRYYSVGADGTFKAWRLGDRRKPRTVELGGALRALALAPKGGSQTAGTLFAGGDARTITTLPLDAEGNPQDKTSPIGHGLQLIEESLASSARPAHETAIKALSALDEQEAIDLLLKHLVSNRFPEVRELVARELAARGREVARPALRERLRSESSTVARLAAYEALKVLEAATPLAAPRAGLESTYPEIRSLALTELALLHESSPLVSGLIADKLRDGDRTVRLAALDAYTSLFPAGSPEPFKTAFERGPADLRAEALVRAALARQLSSPALEPVLARALDDVDSEVRRAAFALKILERPALFALLESRDQDVGRACNEVARQAARFLLGSGKKDLTDALVAEAQQKLLGPAGAKGDGPHGLSEDDLRPLLAAMACRTADTALRGARGLAELGDTRALGALLQLSREGDKAIRREAARALGALEDPRAKKRLVWMLDDADADVRAAALDAFSKLEASAVELAEGALRSSQQDIRVRGLSMLVKQSGSRSVATDTLLGDALEDESPEVRGEAFRTLWAWHQKDPQKALDRALQARFPDLRLKAVSELESSGKEEWAQERLLAAIGDRDAKVAQAAYDALVKIKGKPAAKPHLAALASIHATVRVAGAEGAKKSPVDEVRSALTLQLNDSDSAARGAALGALDKLVTRESGPLYAGLQSSFHDLKVLAAELLADRHDEQIIETIRAFLSDKELLKTQGTALLPLRYRAAKALATLGSPRLLKYFATELLKDDHGDVREQAARGLSNASRKGDEGFLLDALGHTDIAVRSWAAEGLSRLGDARALPVLTGHLRHEHQPIRLGAILSFAALGPEGYGGMLQGLEDPSKDVQEIVFMLILARDLRAFRRGESPELLTSALSSQRPEVRFAAARAIELRSEPARYLDHLVEVLLPPRPEKASEM
jgi:ParB family chromosome partitioning protein